MVFRNKDFAFAFIPKHQLFLLKVRSWRELWSTEEQSQEGNFDDSHQGDQYFHVWWSFSVSLIVIIVMSDDHFNYLWSHLSFDFVFLWSWRAIQLEETQTTCLVLISPDLPVVAFADWRWIKFCFGVFGCCYVCLCIVAYVVKLCKLNWISVDAAYSFLPS